MVMIMMKIIMIIMTTVAIIITSTAIIIMIRRGRENNRIIESRRNK